MDVLPAVALGAEWIERHYTLDRTWKGTDHAASLEPDGVRKLVQMCIRDRCHTFHLRFILPALPNS